MDVSKSSESGPGVAKERPPSLHELMKLESFVIDHGFISNGFRGDAEWLPMLAIRLDVVRHLDFDQFKLTGLRILRKIFASFEHGVVVRSVVPIDLNV